MESALECVLRPGPVVQEVIMNTTQRPQEVRVGVIGTSAFTEEFHLQSLKNHPQVWLEAICSRTAQRVRAVAERHGIPRIYTDYRDLVHDSELDAVVVVTPNNLHHPMTMAALEAGKHVFCEKPLGMTLQEARQMYEKAESAGVTHMTNFTFRGVPVFTRMKGLVEDGYVGRLYHVSVSFLNSVNRGNIMVWRRDKRQAGTGALGDLGSHVIDLAQWLAGPINRVSAHLSTVTKELVLPGTGETVPNETDDTCALVTEFESGAQGVLHANWSALPGPGRIELRAEVHGDRGMLRAEIDRTHDPRSWVTLWGRQDGQETAQALPMPTHLTGGLDFSDGSALIRTMTTKRWYSAQRFVEAVLGNREASPSFYDGMTAQTVIDAAVASHQRGQWIAVA